MSIQRFRIKWDGMTYKVSEPGIESCEVVLAHIYDALQERVAELELRRSETAAMCEQLTVDLESCHTQVSTLQASDRACAEAGADNLSLRLLLADKLAAMTRERNAWQVKYTTAKRIQRDVEKGEFWHWNDDEHDHLDSLICPVVVQPEKIKEWKQQLAASQARCREMEAVRHDYKATLTDAELSDKEYMTAYCSDFHADYGLALKRLAQLQATLTAREAERDDERRKLQDVCMAHGPALMKIHDLERELKRLQLTWTTARPTVAGRYWYKDLDGAHILMIERVHHTDLFVSYEGSLTPLNEYHGEFAGPIPLPTEAQQASGRSGGAEGHGGQP